MIPFVLSHNGERYLIRAAPKYSAFQEYKKLVELVNSKAYAEFVIISGTMEPEERGEFWRRSPVMKEMKSAYMRCRYSGISLRMIRHLSRQKEKEIKSSIPRRLKPQS